MPNTVPDPAPLDTAAPEPAQLDAVMPDPATPDTTAPDPAPRVFSGLAELRAAAGAELGPSAWFPITQQRVDDFARVTEDWQPIHCDPDAAAQSMFGGTIAHGYLTVALLSRFARELYTIANTRTVVNYGLDRVRFPAPLPVGARVRARARIGEPRARGELLEVPVSYTVEAAGGTRPVLIADTLILVEASTPVVE
ncbi:Nodulation protein N [Leucobacter sp. 7(1)]|uniref:MaoC family dehydratase n=1 Tax=Leucobacter sp. 7(1) TaxID=1255613 RepID=UPI00097F5960|nr:MaoC/PaaZ C-terminal domain-containing protein [Leucobacter sp. 7(1)]SJN11100.1 Nodulation protein N [Leucobacter sp. 7(1)]